MPVYSVPSLLFAPFVGSCICRKREGGREGGVDLLRECPLTRHYCVLGSGRISIIRSEIGHCGRRYTAHLLFSLISPIIVSFSGCAGGLSLAKAFSFPPIPPLGNGKKTKRRFFFLDFLLGKNRRFSLPRIIHSIFHSGVILFGKGERWIPTRRVGCHYKTPYVRVRRY